MFGKFKSMFENTAPEQEDIPSDAKNKPVSRETEEAKTPRRLVAYGEMIINQFCKDFKVEGADELKKFKEDHPDDKFVITASHTNNLDVPAVLKTLGEDFDLQVTGNELFFKKAKYLAQNLGVQALFRDHFTSLGQKEESKIESGVLRPENFEELDEIMSKGRTPWIAAHSFSTDGQMRKVSNGALIQAYRQDAYLVPSALETLSGSKSLQGVKDLAENLKGDSGANYIIGEPYKPDPLPDGLDIEIINKVIKQRSSGETVSDADFESFKKVNSFLSEQSEKLGKTISSLLPEDKRGYYKEKA